MNFESLYYRRVKSILGQIAADETDYQEVANLAEHIGVDYYGRFLVELLQNAEDQTTKAGLSEGLVVIVRTDAFVGVLNQGLPFDDKGVKSITSAGISHKKVEESIGNKGVGFKAVFQVSDTPEIFSTAAENAKLTAVERTAFRIERNPFNSSSFRKQIKMTANKVLHEDSILQAQLKSLFGPGKLWPKVLDRLKLAAPFKFPKPLDNDIFKARCEVISISHRLLDRMSTLVVLPLLKGEDTSKVVEQALDELVAADVPGSALLFLRGISRLRVYDHVRKCAWLLSRQQPGESCRLAKGAKIMPLRTTSVQVGMGKISRAHAEWWQIRRRFGHEGDDAESRSEEATSIRAAVARLPGEQWQEVQTAYAAVALPRVPSNQSSPKRYPVVGKMCIGLPSRMATGTPAWLDGPFHGYIARTEIGLKEDSQPYNRLIFEGCIALLWQVVEYVKAIGDIGDQRGILFWFASEQGALTDYFTGEASLDTAKIILASSKDEFLAARTLILPEKDDSDCFESLFGHVPNLEQFGFHLPDSWLLKEGWDILDSLANQSCCIAPASMYIDRSKSDKSLIEMASYLQREAGPEWWEPFLNWLIDRLIDRIPIEKVRDQMVLPVTRDVLARPEDRVFLRPHGLPITRDAKGENEESEESINALDASLTKSLRFLDENRIRVRVADRPDLTDLARKLSPDGADGFVRRPRRTELINDVLLPALRERTQENPRDMLCAKILSCIGEWLSDMREEDRNRIKLKQLLVPTSNTNASWAWRPAEEVYLGKGWVKDPDQEQLINRAYGHRNEARLPSWEDFSAWVCDQRPDDESPFLDMWRRHMEAMGVHAQPRLLFTQPNQGYFRSWSYGHLTRIEDTPPCPFQAATPFWDAYLDYLCQRPSRTRTGQVFLVRPISWIDGLEDPDAREAVMALVLKFPERYEQYVETKVERQDRTDQKSFSSLWMWAIRTQEWEIVPSNDGLRPVDAVWILHGGEKRRRFVEEKLMVWLPEKFNNSPKLTTALGVHTPFDAPIERIAQELHQVAEQLPARDQANERVMKMHIQTLYEWLNVRCESHESGDPNLECLLARPVPLLKSERIECVDLEKASCVYLKDDPQRFSHIAGFTDSYVLPLSAKSGFRAIFDGLRHLLGGKRIRRVSEERIDVGFSESPVMQEGRLLDLIEQHVGTNHGDIAQELATLIAFGRREQPMDPGRQTFREYWNRFRDCRVVFGEFPNDRSLEVLFDRHASEGATLYIAKDAVDKDKDANLVRLSWHIVGPGHRDVFEAFAGVLATDRRVEFLRQRGIGDAEWDEIGSAIGISLEQSCIRLRVAALALWRRECPQGKVSEFESEWDADSEPVAKVSRFFGIDKSDARMRLNDAQRVMDDEEEAELAERAGVTIGEWQEARKLLGLKRVRFSETERNFEKLIRWVAGAITVASRRYVSLDEDSVKSAVDTICSLNCPSALAETRANDQAVLTEALCRAAEVVAKVPQRAMTLLARALRREADQAPDTVQNLRLRGVPRRELNHIFDYDESERTKQAKEAVRSVLRVAKVLAKQYREKLDVTMLKDDVRVIRHTTGWWVNAFAALRALKKAITGMAPRTGRELAQKRAFMAPQSWRELWKAFPELGDPKDETPSTPLPTIRILGLEKTSSEIEADLVPGGDGEIESKLRQYVQPDLDLHALADRARVSIGLGPDVPRRGGTGGWRTTGQRDDDELVGYLGERFVYEHFLAANFPDFDISCWVSENRERYEGQAPKRVGQGYDFRYRDVTGRLTGRKDDAPLCLIEVKTTTGDGQASFPITANEWRVAQECHDPQDERFYLIIRVRQVQDAPEIFDVIIDPIQAIRDGWLQLVNKDFYLVVDHPTESST